MSIHFTQFLRPNGQKKPVVIDMNEDVEKLANQLISNGYKFEIEELSTGVIHMDCSKEDQDPIAIELCQNGPPVVDTVERLVRTAHERAFRVEFYDEDEDPEEFWRSN